jgi:hypothetical protein
VIKVYSGGYLDVNRATLLALLTHIEMISFFLPTAKPMIAHPTPCDHAKGNMIAPLSEMSALLASGQVGCMREVLGTSSGEIERLSTYNLPGRPALNE